jgi:ParB-like chromosome segregation protein Spo0J
MQLVSIGSLLLTDSPRLEGESLAHIELLASADNSLPAVLVHRPTMRVIDGRHRLRAALSLGRTEVAVQFVDCLETDIFALSVAANIGHGLPMSRADRQAAAVRLVRAYPQWSDRAIASVTGTVAGTVAAIRGRQSTAGPTERVGRDGRVRPLDAVRGRLIARDIIVARPTASLREIASEAGISPATARDVRLRLRRGQDPVPEKHRSGVRGTSSTRRQTASATTLRDPRTLQQSLCSDPALRLTDAGRGFLRWFLPRVAGPAGWENMSGTIPSHCSYAVSSLARDCAVRWQRFADQVEQQARPTA